MLPVVGSDFGRYRITGRLGRGGMGVVFSATHRDLKRDVALKLLAPDLADDQGYRNRFLREAQALARLDSPHVIKVFDAGEQDGWLFIVTELVLGGDLKQYIDDHGPLPVDEALAITADAADGLAAAHEAGVLHRDIKPSNVLLKSMRDGRVRAVLCDFGIAAVEDFDATRTQGIIGTPAYLAPERHEGGEASVAADIYAMGCLLWSCLTGQPPYAGTPSQVLIGHLQGEVPQLPDDTEGLLTVNRILRTSLAKDPRQRFEGAVHLAVEIRGALSEGQGGEPRLTGDAVGTEMPANETEMRAFVASEEIPGGAPGDRGTGALALDEQEGPALSQISTTVGAPIDLTAPPLHSAEGAKDDSPLLRTRGPASARPRRTLAVGAAVAVVAGIVGAGLVAFEPWRSGRPAENAAKYAARVESETISLDDLAATTRGICVLQAADPTASATSRTYAELQILEAWINALLDIQYAQDNEIEADAPGSGLAKAPGWSDVDDRDRDAVRRYVSTIVEAQAILHEIRNPDLSSYQVDVNQRFGVRFDGDSFEPVDETSALSEAPNSEDVAALPDEEICGARRPLG